MTLAQYLRVLRKQWWVVLLFAALATGGSAFYTFQQTPVYSATTQLFVSVRTPGSDISDLSQGSTFTQERVKSYADVVTSPQVLAGVVQRLHLPVTPQALAGQISVDTPLDTVLLSVTVQDPSPTEAAAIANTIALYFPPFVTTLETTGQDESSPVKVSVTDPATVPTVPVSPRIPLNLALGLLVGIGVGIGIAVLREQMNTTVNGVSDIEKLTGAIPLGVVPFDSRAKDQPLVDADDQSGRAEAFRTLRTNLQFADVDNPPRVIVVTSPLPNEGKTTSACNLALTLALSGARVVLVDGDLRKPRVGDYLGISDIAGLSSVLAGQHELRDVVVTYGRENLAVLPSGPTPPNPSELLSSQHMVDLTATLANHYDIVVVDAPPLLPVTDAAVLASAADGAVLVVRHGRTRREEAERALQALGAVNAKLLGTLLNFAPKQKRSGAYDGYGYGYGYGYSDRKPETKAPAKGRGGKAKGRGAPAKGRGGKSRRPAHPPVEAGVGVELGRRTAEETAPGNGGFFPALEHNTGGAARPQQVAEAAASQFTAPGGYSVGAASTSPGYRPTAANGQPTSPSAPAFGTNGQYLGAGYGHVGAHANGHPSGGIPVPPPNGQQTAPQLPVPAADAFPPGQPLHPLFPPNGYPAAGPGQPPGLANGQPSVNYIDVTESANGAEKNKRRLGRRSR